MNKGQANELAAQIRKETKDKLIVVVHMLNESIVKVYKEVKPLYTVGLHIQTGVDTQGNVLSDCISAFDSPKVWEQWKKAALVHVEYVNELAMEKQLEEEASKQ